MKRLVDHLLPTRAARSFLAWAAGWYLAVTGVLLALSLRRTGGRMIYGLDDPAIHLVLAQNLVHHGTWGVVPGHFQSASSSPLWTLLMAGWVGAVPFAVNIGALVLNVAAALAIVVLLARRQEVLHPNLRRPWHVVAVGILVVIVAFLPAATMLGMEHLLHSALILAALPLALVPAPVGAGRLRRAAPFLLLAVAALVRFETAFIAGGIAIALAVECLARDGDADGDHPVWRDRLPRAVAVLAVVAVPIAAFCMINKAMGQSWLPNSVIAKSTTLNGTESDGIDLREIMGRLTSDAVLVLLTAACAALVVIGWRDRRPWASAALAVVLATLAHVAAAQVGWYERYQIYLIVAEVGVLLVAAGDLLPAAARRRRPNLIPAFVVLLLLAATTKIDLTISAPRAVSDTYQQRYQAARFLSRYYQDQPIATGELGYIGLLHRGPITDLYGLGDYEVMQARRTYHQHTPPAYWDDLARRRGFKVAAVYPATLLYETPKNWILVGTWDLNRPATSGFDRQFQFWATTPEEVRPLLAHLRAFGPQLPDGVTQTLNELAVFRADVQLEERGG